MNVLKTSVNLPRWGLKQVLKLQVRSPQSSVNLPRWGLKLSRKNLVHFGHCVNLPRWGLKLFICFSRR